VVSANAVSMYAKYPQGYKVYIKLKDLAVGTYGSAIQLGYYGLNPDKGVDEFGRIPEKMVFTSIVRSCTEKATIVPKEMTLTDIRTMLAKPVLLDQNQYLGCLIKVPNAEFDARALCSIYAPDGFTVDRAINDATYTNPATTGAVVRNSGFASFASQTIPSGKGDFIGILSKYNSSVQLYINKVSDLSGMKNFPRKDGLTADPCTFNPELLKAKTVADVKKIYTTGNYTQITEDAYLKAKVTASDETGNLYKYLYVEDATGGIKVNINKLNLYQDARFKIGKNVIIKLKDLYIGKYKGEYQLGVPYNGNIGQIEENNVFKYFIDSKEQVDKVTPTDKTISNLTTDDVGRWIRIKNLQFSADDLGNSFGGNRTLEDCSGNKITLNTNSRATFASSELDNGKGDVTAILSYIDNKYQLLIPYQYNADLDAVRCDGTLPTYETIFSDGFTNLANWNVVSVLGAKQWTTTTYGNPAPSAYMDGARAANEDWLVSNKIAIPSNYSEIFFSFETDGRYNSDPNVPSLEVYVTDNYTGNVATTTWTKKTAVLDTDLTNFAGFVNSGKVDVSSFKGKDLVVAFKYKSVDGFSTTWEVDNFSVKGVK
jgi:hypothetical protein